MCVVIDFFKKLFGGSKKEEIVELDSQETVTPATDGVDPANDVESQVDDSSDSSEE